MGNGHEVLPIEVDVIGMYPERVDFVLLNERIVVITLRDARLLMVQTVRFERQTVESSGFKWFVVRFEI